MTVKRGLALYTRSICRGSPVHLILDLLPNRGWILRGGAQMVNAGAFDGCWASMLTHLRLYDTFRDKSLIAVMFVLDVLLGLLADYSGSRRVENICALFSYVVVLLNLCHRYHFSSYVVSVLILTCGSKRNKALADQICMAFQLHT